MEQARKYGRGTVHAAPMPADELRRLLAYDRETGLLTWKDCSAGGNGARRVRPGTIVTCRNAYGRVVVRVNKVLHQAHRIAWYLETGTWPPQEVDHINGDCGDNRWTNLRLVSPAENIRYMKARLREQPGYVPKIPREPYLAEVSPQPVALDELRQLLSYDPETGSLTWLADRGCNAHRMPAGSRAGSVKDNQYVAVKVNGRFYKAHRLAWFLMTGYWPVEEIDHINGIRGDNRWVNLQLVTRSQNQHRASKSRGASGFRGVYRNRKGWRAQISINGVLKHFPSRATPEEAHADYCAAAREHHGAFARID